MTSVWRAFMDLSKSYICICALQMSGFAGLPVLHLSNPAVCICRQVISTLLLEQRWISPKTIFVFLKSNIFIFRQVISTFDGVCFSSSLLINQIGIHSSNPFSCSAVEGIGWKYHLNGGSHWYNCCTMLFYICSVPAFRWSQIQFFLQIKFTFSKVKLPLFER